MRRPCLCILFAVLAACAGHAPLPDVDLLLLGEQHDASEHQESHRRKIASLAAQGRLAAVAIEMAEQGRSTAALAPNASEQAVQAALGWDEAGWPWPAYRPAIMAAVTAGVPVLGANLPRSELRTAMADSTLDARLAAPALQAQQQAIRDGHCGLLPDRQIAPMTRVQIARDQAMARTLAQAAAPGKTVVLLAGAGHVDRALGVPQHLPAGLRSASITPPAQPPTKDYCEELRRQMRPDRPPATR